MKIRIEFDKSSDNDESHVDAVEIERRVVSSGDLATLLLHIQEFCDSTTIDGIIEEWEAQGVVHNYSKNTS